MYMILIKQTYICIENIRNLVSYSRGRVVKVPPYVYKGKDSYIYIYIDNVYIINV